MGASSSSENGDSHASHAQSHYEISETDEKGCCSCCTCCCGAHNSSEHSLGKHDKEILVKQRHTTDVLFLILIIGLWIAMSSVGGKAIKNGDPYRLVGPFDASGSICGYSPSVQNEKYLYTVTTYGLGVCVDSCPTVNASLTSLDSNDYYCLDSVYAMTDDLTFPTYIQTACMTNGIYNFTLPTCLCNLKFESTSIFRRCIFDDYDVRIHYMTQNGLDYFQSFIADIITARNVIFAFGFLVALGLSFLLTLFLRFEILGDIICWSLVLAVQALFVAMTILAYRTTKIWQAEEPPIHTHMEIKSLQVFAGVMMGISFLYLCLMIFLRKALNTAIKTVSLAARAIDDMPFIVFTPAAQIVGFVLFMIPMMFYCFYLASNGQFVSQYETLYPGTPPPGISNPELLVGKTWQLAPGVQERLWFMFFCLLWTMNFIEGVGSMVIAIATAEWYFTPKHEKKIQHKTSWTVIRAYHQTFRYHLGTIAFGSLIIALVQFIRTVAIYMQKHCSKKMRENPIVKFVFCCVNCLLYCLEKCLKFISTKAYIQTSIHSTSFCVAMKDAFFVVARNILTIGAVALVSTLALLLGKIFVCLSVLAGSYYFLNQVYSTQLYGFVAPLLLIMVIAYMTSSMFMDVFHMCIDSILMCYITDSEANGGKPQYADDHTHEFIEKHGKMDPKKIPPSATPTTTTMTATTGAEEGASSSIELQTAKTGGEEAKV